MRRPQELGASELVPPAATAEGHFWEAYPLFLRRSRWSGRFKLVYGAPFYGETERAARSACSIGACREYGAIPAGESPEFIPA